METFRDLNDFLRHHKANKDDVITHTRIGDGEGIYGGKYSIPQDKMNIFNKLYHREVFINKKPEYLTEVQLKSHHRPIVVDLDFRYSPNVTERKHSIEHIEDIIMVYVDCFNKIMGVDVEVPVYVMQKDNVNCQENVTKDGIHIIFGIACDSIIQQMIRENVKPDIGNIIEELELTNNIDDVLDSGISQGHTNWQLYGSRKPKNQPYKLTHIYSCEVDSDGDVMIDKEDLENDNLKLMEVLSVRNSRAPYFHVKDSYQEDYDKIKNNAPKKKLVRKSNKKFTVEGFNFDISEIRSVEILEKLVDKLLNELTTEEYNINETHQFLMSLPVHYYDNYDKWIRCGWALHNTNFKLFISWIYFSSQSSKFNFDDIPGYYEMWKQMKDEGVTERSIMYWAREENPAEYKRIREETIDYYIELTEEKATEWDIANVLYQLYKDEYRCANLKKNIWYQFKNNRWREIDSGTTLRYNISKTLSRIYSNKSDKWMHILSESEGNGVEKDKQESYRKKAVNYSDISSNLKRTTFKQNIMKEAAEIFYQSDPNFVDNLDQKRHLLCFENGVWDFDTKTFRDGRPDDYITLSTGIRYVPFNKNKQKDIQIKNEIEDFMTKLFPVVDLRKYIWEHLASTLIGKNKSQTFNIYNGCGRNGKSKLVELMSMVLGDYKGVVPITLVTQKRNNIGSLSPEIAALKGVRYAVMQEPSKGDKLNDGIMKELTGEDPIQGRGLYQDAVTFVPQFKLVVCTNTLFDIKSNDDGTWRRIRLCEFMSKFVKEPNPTEHSPYEFSVDQNISIKFEQWKHIFMDMLVQITLEQDGLVTDCDMVMKASNEYRAGQDYLMEFLNDKVEKSSEPGIKIKKTEVYAEFKVWYQETYGKNIPKGKELYDFLDQKLGKCRTGGWPGYKIKYDMENEGENEFNIDGDY
jgi:P4 family phage/plasmid primase-like protien